MSSARRHHDHRRVAALRARRREARRREIRRRRFLAVVVLAAALSWLTGVALAAAGNTGGVSPAGDAPAGASAAKPSPARSLAISCPSPALGGTLPAMVYLPSGYGTPTHRYPVVYFLHGLPADPSSYRSLGFVAGAIAGARRTAIVVVPQGARSANSDREYLDWDATENWPRAISHDLVSCIDHRYRTVADRHGRVLAGLSAGGYGAFNIGLRSLSTFAAVESWSGYFQATNPAGTAVLQLGSAAANAAATVPNGTPLRNALAHYPTYIAFYVGNQDTRFRQDNETYAAQMQAAAIPHVFRTYPGGHSGSLWRAEAPPWLENALGALAHPPSVK